MILGIDRASVDGGKCDWQRARAAGCTFAFLRACYGTVPDKAFTTEWPKLQAAGIVGGAYLFWRVEQDPQAQVDACEAVWDACLEKTRQRLGAFPPVVDVEFPNGLKGYSPGEALERLESVVAALHRDLGVQPMLYTSSRVWREDLKGLPPLAGISDSPLWLARYLWPSKLPWRPPPTGAKAPLVPASFGRDADCWWIHQYAGDATGFPGFSSTVDLNRFNPLFKGCKGDRVKWLQRKLGVVSDGTFGPVTEGRLRDKQRSWDLVPDGIVGPRSFARLCWEG